MSLLLIFYYGSILFYHSRLKVSFLITLFFPHFSKKLKKADEVFSLIGFPECHISNFFHTLAPYLSYNQ